MFDQFCLYNKQFCLYNKQKNTWVLGNTRFISRVEHMICSTLEINMVFPRTHVLFSIYFSYIVATVLICIGNHGMASTI